MNVLWTLAEYSKNAVFCLIVTGAFIMCHATVCVVWWCIFVCMYFWRWSCVSCWTAIVATKSSVRITLFLCIMIGYGLCTVKNESSFFSGGSCVVNGHVFVVSGWIISFSRDKITSGSSAKKYIQVRSCSVALRTWSSDLGVLVWWWWDENDYACVQ